MVSYLAEPKLQMLLGSWYVLISCSLCRLLIRDISAKEGDVNPFTKQPLTAQYKTILAARKKLPVHTQMEEFYKMVSPYFIYVRGCQSLRSLST